jgi:hypothetical protein
MYLRGNNVDVCMDFLRTFVDLSNLAEAQYNGNISTVQDIAYNERNHGYISFPPMFPQFLYQGA